MVGVVTFDAYLAVLAAVGALVFISIHLLIRVAVVHQRLGDGHAEDGPRWQVTANSRRARGHRAQSHRDGVFGGLLALERDLKSNNGHGTNC